MGALTVVGLTLALSLFIARSAEGTETCGKKQLAGSELIAHGYTARADAWPWHGAMFHAYGIGRSDYACGVTILTEHFVLTAAHCTYERWQKLPPGRVFIKVGFSNLGLPEFHVRQFNVEKIIRHEEYDEDTFENDIALMKLYNEITYNSYIQPVCLWQGDTELSKIISKIGYVVGWGLHERYSLSEHLSEATMSIVSSKTCWEADNRHYNKFYFESKTFCAGRLNGTHVSHGDSGGGLYMRMGTTWVLRGIVSNVKINPNTLKVQADSYAIFTDVAYYLNWIKAKVPDIPYFTVDTEQITETEFNGDANLLDLKNCGKYTFTPGTRGEEKLLMMQFPWEAVIKVYNNTESDRSIRRCVGFLIHPSFVIAMAKCLIPHGHMRNIIAKFRELGSIDNSSTRIRIYETYIHPKYSITQKTSNIAMGKLERPATVNPICLPLSDPLELPDASQLHTIGVNLYAGTRDFRNVSQLVDLEACKQYYTYRVYLTKGQICSTIEDGNFFYYLAQWQHVKKDFFEGQYFLAAFSTHGPQGIQLEAPTVFTNVAYYSEWIRDMIKINASINILKY